MANSILADFYNGDLHPGENDLSNHAEYREAAERMCEVHERLQSSLKGDMLRLLDEYTDAQIQTEAAAERISYIEGFKMGARFMLAILDDEHGDLQPPGEKS